MKKNFNNRCNKNLIIKSRVTVSRNIKGKNFTPFLDEDKAIELADYIENKFLKINGFEFKTYKLREESKIDMGIYLERDIISKELFNNKKLGEFLYDQHNDITVMINEGNHIKLSTISKKISIKESYKKLRNIDDELDNIIDIAFNEKLGYLTMDKNTIGTAMNVFIIIHLPILTLKGQIDELTTNLKKIDIKLRGLFDYEKADGTFYEISNIKSIGVTEDDLVNNLEAVANEIIMREKRARDEILIDYNFMDELEDEIFRAYGILKNARLITFQEALQLISKIRLGVEFDIINSLSIDIIDNLIYKIQHYSLKSLLNNNYSEKEELVLRAKIIREELIG